MAMDADLAWSDETLALIHIEYLIRLLMWGLGGGKGEKPKPLQTPSQLQRLKERFEDAESLMQEVARDIGISD